MSLQGRVGAVLALAGDTRIVQEIAPGSAWDTLNAWFLNHYDRLCDHYEVPLVVIYRTVCCAGWLAKLTYRNDGQSVSKGFRKMSQTDYLPSAHRFLQSRSSSHGHVSRGREPSLYRDCQIHRRSAAQEPQACRRGFTRIPCCLWDWNAPDPQECNPLGGQLGRPTCYMKQDFSVSVPKFHSFLRVAFSSNFQGQESPSISRLCL